MVSTALANRLGFTLLGMTTNFAFIIMLSAAYDLLHESSSSSAEPELEMDYNADNNDNNKYVGNNTKTNESFIIQEENNKKPFCNEQSTSTILLADTVPSLIIKIIYPFLLVSIPASYKVIATVLLALISFIITGLTSNKLLIFVGIICAGLVQGIGEATFLAITPSYGDTSLSGWSTGTGIAGVMSSVAYVLLRMILPTKVIMMIMLIVPLIMLVAFFKIIKPIEMDEDTNESIHSNGTKLPTTTTPIISSNGNKQQTPFNCLTKVDSPQPETFNFMDKVRYLPKLTKYFLPLLLVFFTEYFINQGLHELVYYPEVASYLDHAAQYRWFQVSYQVGVMISRSTLDFIKFKNIWAMSLLQLVNMLIFIAHVAKFIHLPSFYLVVILTIYEGLLGGFTYVNAFYRIKKESPPGRQEFSISAVVIADTSGILIAGLLAIPAHNSLCKLYS